VIRWVGVVPITLAMLFGVTLLPAADAPTLEDRASAIERASTLPEGVRVGLGHLSRELKLSAETLRADRTKTGLGWGELLIAHRLSRSTQVPVDRRQSATRHRIVSGPRPRRRRAGKRHGAGRISIGVSARRTSFDLRPL